MPRATKAASAATNGGAPVTPPEVDAREIKIPRPTLVHATLKLVSDSPLIMHKWSVKALKQLEGSQTGKAKAPREPKNPEEEALGGAYIVPGMENEPNEPGKFYYPGPAFKHAYLYGVSQLDDVKQFPKTRATGWVFIDGDPILDFVEVIQRTDVGRNPTQMVYRLQFNGWSCNLGITYNSNSITAEQIASLFDLGGVGGIGEWRPTSPKNKSGDFGRFHVEGIGD
jgi:hypothetical protein